MEMKTPIETWFRQFAIATILGLLTIKSPVAAQDESDPAPPQATTVSDAEIPVDNLQVVLRPLMRDDCQLHRPARSTGRHVRRVDLVFGIGYNDDIQQAADLLMEKA